MPVERNIHDVDTLFLALEISCDAGGVSLNLHFEQYQQRPLFFFFKKKIIILAVILFENTVVLLLFQS